MTEVAGPLGGHCLCGAIRYRVPYPFAGQVAHCHCTMCRRAAGSVVVTWFTVAKADFELLGGELAIHRSSDHGERGFCGTCGSPVTFWSSHYPDTIDVTLATLDHPEAIAPDLHIFAESRLPWLRLDTHLPDRSDGGDDVPPASTG